MDNNKNKNITNRKIHDLFKPYAHKLFNQDPNLRRVVKALREDVEDVENTKSK